MENKLQNLELTWIGKKKRPGVELRVQVEDTVKSHHAVTRIGFNWKRRENHE